MDRKIKAALKRVSSPRRAAINASFFKTGKGAYGEGDIFLGVTVPDARKVAKAQSHAPLSAIRKLLQSKIHEHRLTALLILVHQYQCGTPVQQERIVRFCLTNARCINNWDLVDLSAPYIFGQHLITHPEKRKRLYRLAKSKNLWERRIAIVATLAFIRNQEFRDTLQLATQLLGDTHDLMHKATGWMLREMGKRDERPLRRFLREHAHRMPRTMLRYAIERLPEQDRKRYLGKRTR